MAVEFPSDLIMDVARAADPASARSVEARLNAGAATETGNAHTVRTGAHLSRVAQSKDANDVGKEFEAMLVSGMISDMMGDAEESYFGGGFAGSVWQSMMAEHIANQVVASADFGVASKVSEYFVRNGENVEPMRGINDAGATTEETRTQDAARQGTQEISRDFIRDMMSLNGSGGDN